MSLDICSKWYICRRWSEYSTRKMFASWHRLFIDVSWLTSLVVPTFMHERQPDWHCWLQSKSMPWGQLVFVIDASLIYLSVIELGATPVRLVSLARVSVRACSGFRAAEPKSLQMKARGFCLFDVVFLCMQVVLVFINCKFLHARHKVFHFMLRNAACHIGPEIKMHL